MFEQGFRVIYHIAGGVFDMQFIEILQATQRIYPQQGEVV